MVVLSALPTAIRWINLPLILFVPGLAFIGALFGAGRPANWFIRLVLAVVLTQACISLLGVAAASIGWSWSRRVSVFSASGFSLVCVGVWVLLDAKRLRAPENAGGQVDTRGDALEAETAPEEYPGDRNVARRVMWPLVSGVLGIVVAVGSVAFFARKPEPAFSVIAFDRGWALASGVVPVDTSTDVVVDVRVEHHGGTTAKVRVTADVGNETTWKPIERSIKPGGVAHLSLNGKVPVGTCRTRLQVTLVVEGGSEPISPLVVYVRDRDAACAATGSP
jgi:hypothetical protein